ncbi:MAG TPA: hypothetical protein VJ841_01060 [Candidatus Saccharimonadales bacterium]|nr:hypothetical protein [Candidatus Saccharimonadales bacterium]
MRFSLLNKHIPEQKRQEGFTLIEMLIIAPIVILAIGGFVALMVTMVGEVLVTREESTLTYNTQAALDRIEQDVRLSTQFLVTTGTLTTPQGSDDATAAFSNTSNTLLLSTLATDKNPTDISRGLVYLDNQPNPCSGDKRYNRVLLNKVIYYIKNGSLWRRTVVPDWTLTSGQSTTVCSAPWQQDSCTPGYTASLCQTNDEKIMDNITSLGVQYYAAVGDTSTITADQATRAATINVTITSSKTVSGGNTASNTANIRVSKLNDIDTTQLPPASPVVTHSGETPDSVEFTWAPVPTATAYQVQYSVNGGQTVKQTLDAATTKYTVNGVRNDSITIKVSAFNNAGSSAPSTDTATVPNWITLGLTDDFAQYSASYNKAAFSKTASGRVFLKGLVKYITKDSTGNVPASIPTSNTNIIGNLPEGYRPSAKLVFQVLTSPNAAARIDVYPNGDIVVVANGNSSWVSLDTISFLPSGQPYTWNAANYNSTNNWSDWDTTGATYERVHSTRDNLGRVNMQGLARAGTNTSNTTIFTLPSSAYYPNITASSGSLHFPAGGNGYAEFWVWYDGDVVKRGPQTSSYLGLQALFYPGTSGSWTPIPFASSTTTSPNPPWVNYAGSYPTLACTKGSDDVVTIRGLIKSGTPTTSVEAATLPSACPAPATADGMPRLVMMAASNDDVGRIDITSAGKIYVVAGSTNWIAVNMSYLSN